MHIYIPVSDTRKNDKLCQHLAERKAHKVTSPTTTHRSSKQLRRVLEADVHGLLVTPHIPQVHAAAAYVLGDRLEVHVGDVPLLAELPDGGRDQRVVGVADPGEEVVLDLVVEAAVKEAEDGAAHVGGGHHLQLMACF